MESNVKILAPEDLIPHLLKLLEETDSVPLLISGNSMSPFLIHHRDTVYLSKIQKKLKRGDMVLYRRNSGHYVLHRIYRAQTDRYTMVGDAQTVLEPDIRREQILASICAVRRKGKLLKPSSFWWIFFQYVWIRIVPLRPLISAAYSGVTRLFR